MERIGAGNNSWRLGPWGHSWRRAAVLCGTSVLLGNLLSARSIWAPHSALNCPRPTLADCLILFQSILVGRNALIRRTRWTSRAPRGGSNQLINRPYEAIRRVLFPLGTPVHPAILGLFLRLEVAGWANGHGPQLAEVWVRQLADSGGQMAQVCLCSSPWCYIGLGGVVCTIAYYDGD